MLNNRRPKSENFNSKYNFQILKKPKIKLRKDPLNFPKNQKHIKGGLKSKCFIKHNPQKWAF